MGFSPARKDGKDCFICRGTFQNSDRIVKKVLPGLRRFEFRTFAVGLTLPSYFQENEDRVRSELRIRGGETVKSELAARIAAAIAKSMKGKRVDRMKPDLTALVNVENRSVEVTSRPLLIYGRYTKPRGVSQRRSFCDSCNGSGCEKCGGTGYSRLPSVEGMVTAKLDALIGSSKVKFTWFGSEDTDSLVLPPGRPFVAEAKNPRKRTVPRSLSMKARGAIRVTNLVPLKRRVEEHAFKFKTRALIEAGQPLTEDEVRKLEKSMRNVVVKYRNNKGRIVDKTVYSVKASKRGKKLTAEIKLDGGLPVKRLVSGEDVSPSFSDSIGVPLRCKRFDIMGVWPAGRPPRS